MASFEASRRHREDVKEGFICPMCMKDLQSFHNLQNHFESEHSNEDKAFMNQIKGVFSKARDKLFNKENDQNDENRNLTSRVQAPTTSYTNLDMSFWEPQELGMTRHSTDKFRAIRDARIDRTVIETNKIIIRLEKILQMPESERNKRKEYERSLVPWVDDEDVPFCPTCGDKFNIARRRHHCRLCGAIMCTRCSIFLSVREAEELIERNRQARQSSPSRNNLTQPFLLTLSEDDIEKISVRVCIECDKVLQRNIEKLNLQLNSSLLVLLHNKMVSAIESAQKLAPEFQTIADSLNNGEEEYKLNVANEKRFKLMQAFEAVDVISKKIAVLYTEDEDNPLSPGALKLQNSIRRCACSFLQDNMLTLPSLPSAPKLAVLQAKRRAENERRIRKQREEAQRLREEKRRIQELEKLKAERELAERTRNEEMMFQDEQHMRYTAKLTNEEESSSSAIESAVVGDPGWSADAIPKTHKAENGMDDDSSSDDDDILGPLSEQISYVEQSMNQARAAGLQSEAESLERNLHELKSEYKRMRAQKNARAFGTSSFVAESPRRTNSFDESDEGDAMLYQIKYITKCISDAEAAEKYDEVRILTENLDEIKQIYNRSNRK